MGMNAPAYYNPSQDTNRDKPSSLLRYLITAVMFKTFFFVTDTSTK